MQDSVYSIIENKPRPTLTAASGFVLLAAIGLWVSELLLNLLPVSADNLAALECAVYYLPFAALPLALYMRRHPGLSEAMRLGPVPALGILAAAALALLSVYASSAVTALWGWGLDALGLNSIGGAPTPQTQRALLMSVVTLAAIPAVCEELMFRGFVLSAWESRGTYFAIGISAGLFALMHGNLYGLPAYLLVGTVSGLACVALDSVYAGIVYHTVYNAACLVLSYMMADADDGAALVPSLGLAASVALDAMVTLSLIVLLLVALLLRARRAGIGPIPRIRRPLANRERLMLAATLVVMLATLAIVQAIALMQGGAA